MMCILNHHTASPPQVTHSFCKEFLRVLLANVGPEGDLAVVDVMRRLFCGQTSAGCSSSGGGGGGGGGAVTAGSAADVSQLQPGGKAKQLSEAYHRYTLNYINALTYLETLRRQHDFCEFEKVSKNVIM